MTLSFDTSAHAAQGRDFLNTLSAVNLDVFSDICMEGQPGALELLDVTGTKRALTLSPTGLPFDPGLTPHYDDGANGKRVKFVSDRQRTPDMGSSSTAGSVHFKLEQIERPTSPLPPPATTVNNPVVICDLLSALDTDVLLPDIPSLSHFPPRLSLALKVHPHIEKIAPDAYKEMRILHLKHLDSPMQHEMLWSFAFTAKYYPPWFLTQYIRETKPHSLFLGAPRVKLSGNLPTHVHDVCWAKSTYNSKQLCSDAWDYVMDKGMKLKDKFRNTRPEFCPKHTVVDPLTNTPIRGPNGQLPWIVTLPLPFIEGIHDVSTRHLHLSFPHNLHSLTPHNMNSPTHCVHACEDRPSPDSQHTAHPSTRLRRCSPIPFSSPKHTRTFHPL